MSRFSPGSVTQDRSGEIIGAAISQALGGIGARRRQNEIRKRQDAETQRQHAIQDASLAEQGVHLTKPGELPPQFDISVSGVPNADDIVSRAIAPALMPTTPRRPGTPMDESPHGLTAALSRHLTIGPGFYIDKDEQAANAKQSSDARVASILAEALAKGQAQSILDPYAVSDRHAVAQSTVERNSRPTPRNIDPLSPEGIQAAIAKARGTLGVQTSVHAANRDYDVAHPMPTQDNGKMTEFSNKAALVYPRAAEAATLLDPFFEKGVPANSLLGKVTFGQYGVSPEIQRANQAAETVASAILRLESGAAISVEEARNYARQFLPQPGDSYEVRQQKKAILQTQLERMRQAANPTMRRDTSEPMTGGDTAGKTITVNGKTFKVPE